MADVLPTEVEHSCILPSGEVLIVCHDGSVWLFSCGTVRRIRVETHNG
jgi:hypothetical protein